MILVSSLKCPKCGDIIYSRAHHDFRSCSCGSVSIDGGFEYTRYLGDPKIFAQLKIEALQVDADKKELFDDWNYSRNKFGLIKGETNVKNNRRTKRPKKNGTTKTKKR